MTGRGRAPGRAPGDRHIRGDARPSYPGVLLLDGDQVITGTGQVLDAPPAGPPGEMLDRIHARIGDGLVLITAREPSWSWLTGGAGGWMAGGGPAWFTLARGQDRMRFCLLDKADPANDPLIASDPVTSAVRHQWFAALTGVPFYADGGSTAGLLLDATVRVNGHPPLRAWHNERAPRAQEPAWLGPWSVPEYAPGIQLDKNAYYLCAANSAVLPLDALTHTPHPRTPDDRVGYWRIQVPANPDPRLPHPLGSAARPGEWRWVAQPTVDLLTELGVPWLESESWTCPRDRARRALVPWYERLRDARTALLGQDDRDSRAVWQALRDTYSRGIGCLDRETRRWYRPDWRAIIYAQARCGLYRAIRKAAAEEGRWPSETRTDSVVYEGSDPPAAFTVGTGLGQWKVNTVFA